MPHIGREKGFPGARAGRASRNKGRGKFARLKPMQDTTRKRAIASVALEEVSSVNSRSLLLNARKKRGGLAFLSVNSAGLLFKNNDELLEFSHPDTPNSGCEFLRVEQQTGGVHAQDERFSSFYAAHKATNFGNFLSRTPHFVVQKHNELWEFDNKLREFTPETGNFALFLLARKATNWGSFRATPKRSHALNSSHTRPLARRKIAGDVKFAVRKSGQKRDAAPFTILIAQKRKKVTIVKNAIYRKERFISLYK